ncbi:MAG: GntR family transcriptional regulator [Actinomycetota bacterium]|nr:GntR family transcriptional regulator [Actinomycetota bacterium]
MTSTRNVRRSLSDKAYLNIKDEILTGRLRPGEIVAANQLADVYRMSRTPIHEALKLLASEGLVQVIPRVGYVISSISVTDVQEIFQLRVTLEALALELALQRVTDKDIEAFERIQAATKKAARSIPRSDPQFVRRSIEANRDFHARVADLSGNRRLADMIRGLLDESQRIMLLDPNTRKGIDFMSSPQHREVVDALARRDRDAAREAMIGHIRLAQERILASMLPQAAPDVLPEALAPAAT